MTQCLQVNSWFQGKVLLPEADLHRRVYVFVFHTGHTDALWDRCFFSVRGNQQDETVSALLEICDGLARFVYHGNSLGFSPHV